jgi:DNA-binding NarL/FixJ family response regulator
MTESLNLPANRIHSIKKRCIDTSLSLRQEQIVIALACAFKTTEIAELTGLSFPTVGRHVTLIAQRIFGGTETPTSRETLTIWASEHRGCCTENAWRRLAEGDLYDDLGDARHLNGKNRLAR